MPEQTRIFLNKTAFFNAPSTSVADFSPAELGKALAFHRTMPGYAPTPLVSLGQLASKLGVGGIYVKDESHRFGLNAFKVLGGAYALGCHIAQRLGTDIAQLPFEVMTSEAVRKQLGEVVFATTTDGNHGRGVAWTARQLKQKAVVYMPQGASAERLNAIRSEGATAEILPMNYDAAVRYTAELAQRHGWQVVQDTAWPGYEQIPLWIMQGYGTLMLEAMEQLHALAPAQVSQAAPQPPTHIIVQAGVGSLAAAVQAYVVAAYGANRPKLIVAEARAADCIYRSAMQQSGEAVAVGGDLDTVMAGLSCGEASATGWQILRDYSDAFASCPDYVAARGMRMLAAPLPGDASVVSGESGAVTLGLLSLLMQSPALASERAALGLDASSRVLVLSTEGDTDPQSYRRIVWDGAIATPASVMTGMGSAKA
ncbi:MAG: diaminopropionate ammonia-lyase [Brachymonas sp.]|nr:diaminopropionate ammonia-lyase [Brachymonas sp.]